MSTDPLTHVEFDPAGADAVTHVVIDAPIGQAQPLRPAEIADSKLYANLKELATHGLAVVCDTTPTQCAGGWSPAQWSDYFERANLRMQEWAARCLTDASLAYQIAERFNTTHFGDGPANGTS